MSNFHPGLLLPLLKAHPWRSIRGGYAASPSGHPPLPHPPERQRGDRTDTGLKHSRGEECPGHRVQDSSSVTSPAGAQPHHAGEDTGTAPAQPGMARPTRSGSLVVAPNTPNMNTFHWRLGLGSSSARAMRASSAQEVLSQPPPQSEH